MTWKKHFKTVSNALDSAAIAQQSGGPDGSSTSKFSSILPEIYAGHPNRIQRYYQYEDMGRDSDISAALDTIADFCTQSEEQNDQPFIMNFLDEPSETQVKVLKQAIKHWVKINKLKSRLWKMMRDCAQFGDTFFVRDPEDHTWLWIDHFAVELVKMSPDGKQTPDEYVVKNFNPFITEKFGTPIDDVSRYRGGGGSSQQATGRPAGTSNGQFSMAGSERDIRNRNGIGQQTTAFVSINAEHMVHLSLNEQMDVNFPFGKSLLDPVFKTFKQKELLEDSILIYRVQRAPERRVFYIDVGNMNGVRAQAYIEGIKNEIHQRRIPNRTGGGSCFALNTRIPLLDGRTLELNELISEHDAGKTNWVYSCDPKSGEFAPGKITWAGVTRKNTQVMKLTLDNGETIICTPDHKFPLLGKEGKTEAKDIIPNHDSLISFHTREKEIDKKIKTRGKSLYTQIFNHSTKKWAFVHREVVQHFRDSGHHQELVFEIDRDKKSVIHHADFNRFNNEPDNLKCMNGYDHFLLHAKSNAQYRASLSEEEKIKLSSRMSQSLRESWIKRKADPKQLAVSLAKQGAATKLFIENNPTHKAQLIRNLTESDKPWRNQSIAFNDEMLTIIVDTIRNGSERDETVRLLNNNARFIEIYVSLNSKKNGYFCKLLDGKICAETMMNILKKSGYSSGWKNIISEISGEWKRKGRKLTWDQSHMASMIKFFGTEKNQAKLIELVSADEDFMQSFRVFNTKRNTSHVNFDRFTKEKLLSLLTTFGYDGWKDFTTNAPLYNHKVVSCEVLEYPMDVGTITVDGKEEFHDFHTFALESGVYTFNSVMDTAYNPLSMLDDYFFAQTSEGRGSKVEVLPSGDALGEITDLTYFTKKMARGLRIPTSYLALGDDEQPAAYNDGKLGAALIQEYRFNKFCMRLQSLLAPVFDRFFKEYLEATGIQIESDLFELQFNPPQNFTKYRQIELDLQQTQVYSAVSGNTKLSERFKFKRFLNMSDEEVIENETMWMEENPDAINDATGSTVADQNPEGDLGSVGLRPDSGFDVMPPTSGEDFGGEPSMDEGPTPEPPEGEAP